MENWHNLEVNEVFSKLKTSEHGLSEEEAKERLAKYGPNKLKEIPPPSIFEIFLNQFKSPLVLILLVAMLIAGILNEWKDFFVIGAIVVLNSILGTINEFKAEKAIEALKAALAPFATVRRGDVEKKVPSENIVPGDLIILETGDRIPADARLYKVIDLATQEASLTGESLPVEKHCQAIKGDKPIAERANIVYASTLVTKGKGEAIVFSTGMETEIGKIAGIVQAEKPVPTPLQLQLKSFSNFLTIGIILIVLLIFSLGLAFGKPIFENFLVAVALAVAAIPEGLPAIVTLTLALATRKMASKNALIRKLPSVETLGSCDVVCSDKTGTLTCNEMTVRQIWANGEEISVTGSGYMPEGKFSSDPKNFELLLKAGALCNNAKIVFEDKRISIIGDPTEAALLVSARKAGFDIDKLNFEYPRLNEIPFTSERKMMSVVVKSDKKSLAFAKGAPEVVLKKCSFYSFNNKIYRLTTTEREKILEVAKGFAEQALRVLGFAYKEIEEEGEEIERNMIFLGFQAMIDPPRAGVKEAIKECENAKIKVVMITGDHLETAKAIAKEIGIKGKAITGLELERMSDAELKEKILEIGVFARVNPEHKVRILKAFKAQGKTVAMTGDGVNDAPALKLADIGIAMGIAGTDVAKEASEMVLADDHFSTIVGAIREGRRVFDNIRKFVLYLLSSNSGEILTILIAMLLALPLPLLAIHILWINLITDGLPALALGVEREEKGIMRRPPRKAHEHLVEFPHLIFIILVGLVMAIGTISIFLAFNPWKNLAKAQTIAFITLVLYQLFNVLNCRSKDSIFKIGFFTNKNLLMAIGFSILTLILATTLPQIQFVMATIEISLSEWIYAIAVASSALIVGEIFKFFVK